MTTAQVPRPAAAGTTGGGAGSRARAAAGARRRSGGDAGGSGTGGAAGGAGGSGAATAGAGAGGTVTAGAIDGADDAPVSCGLTALALGWALDSTATTSKTTGSAYGKRRRMPLSLTGHPVLVGQVRGAYTAFAKKWRSPG